MNVEGMANIQKIESRLIETEDTKKNGLGSMTEARWTELSQQLIKILPTSFKLNTNIVDTIVTKIKVYPNPFSTHILVNSLEDNIHIYVFNVMGQEVYSAAYQSTGADLSGLAPGMYVLHAMSNEKTIINTKILKQ